MKKVIIGIFAHPDDEAFGPAGTLLEETKSGTELHLVCLTAGDAGMNPDNVPDLAATRLKEWEKSASLLGAKSRHFLGYKDGQLNNAVMIEAGQKIIEVAKTIAEGASDDTEFELLAFDLGGLSGHIDHIVASRAACWAFYTLKNSDERFRRIRLYCLPAELAPEHSVEWLFKEQGRAPEEIDEIIDARPLRDEIIEVMHAHYTQRGDYERIIEAHGKSLGLNCFVVKS